jgi:hypothetical protein
MFSVVLIINANAFSFGNNPPNAVDDTEITRTNTAVTIDVLANDSDPDGDSISIKSITTAPTNGMVALDNDGLRIIYTPNNNFTGTDTFEYEIEDNAILSETDRAMVTVNVSGSSTPFYQNQYACGIFAGALTSYEHITMGQNNIYNSCEISVAEFDESTNAEDVTCYIDDGHRLCSCSDTDNTNCSNNGTCTIIPEPKNKYNHDFIKTSDTSTNSISEDIVFKELEYGNYTFTNSQQIYFNPQKSYEDNDAKVMLLGDFRFAGNGQELTFEGGDYYFNSFKTDRDEDGNINTIDICAKDDIRIFVHEDFVYSGNHLNNAGCDGNIFIYVEGDAILDANSGASSNVSLFLYSKGDVKIEPSGKANEWVGAITAEGKIDISKDNSNPPSNFNFIYDDSIENFGLGECQMCYTEIQSSGFTFGMSMDQIREGCPGFSFSLFSDIKVPIEAKDALSNVTVDEAHTGSAFSFGFMNNQEVIDQNNNQIRYAQVNSDRGLLSIDAGVAGVDVLSDGKVITYPLGDNNRNYGPTNSNYYQKLHSSTMISFDICEWAESLVYVAHYDDGNRHYDVALSQCTVDKNNCGQAYVSGPFDAWDTFRDNTTTPPIDRNISTKIVSKPFKLSLASLNSDNTQYETKAGESSNIEVNIYNYPNLKPISNTVYFDANTTAHISNSDEFIVSKAVKQAVVGFRLCATYDNNDKIYHLYPSSECSGGNYDCNATTEGTPTWHICYAKDDFAIRPNKFAIIKNIDSNISSEDDVNITLQALDADNIPAIDYNETLSFGNSLSSPVLEYNVTKAGCSTETLNITQSDIKFVNGEVNITVKYNDVGDINIILHENNGFEFAKVDNDDTDYNAQTDDTSESDNTYDREITPDNQIFGFIPHHFDIYATIKDHHQSPDTNFTYISSDLNMSATIAIDIIAKNKNGDTVKNYTSTCYAQPIDLNFTFQYNTHDDNLVPMGLNRMYYLVEDREDSSRYYNYDTYEGVPLNTKKLDHAIDTNAIFPTGEHNSTAYLNVKIGYDRANNTPINPFELNSNISVIDLNGVTNLTPGKTSNATYLYARAKSTKFIYDDITANSVATPIKVEVYCDRWPVSATNCPNVDILNGATNDTKWYISTNHNSANDDGTISLETPMSDVEITTNIDIINGGINNNISVTSINRNAPLTVPVYLSNNISKWLIYNPSSPIAYPTPFYSVGFIGNSTWGGIGKTGNIVNTDTNYRNTRRLEW